MRSRTESRRSICHQVRVWLDETAVHSRHCRVLTEPGKMIIDQEGCIVDNMLLLVLWTTLVKRIISENTRFNGVKQCSKMHTWKRKLMHGICQRNKITSALILRLTRH